MGFATCIHYYAENGAAVAADSELARHPLCSLDIHLPPGAGGPVPALVWYHGGGFIEGDKDIGPGFVRIVNDLGFASVQPNYRLAPAVRHPEYLADGVAAMSWIQRHGGSHGIDTQRIVTGGISAGAYLAAILLMHPTLLSAGGGDPSLIRGAFLLSGQMSTHFKIREEKGLGPHAVLSDEHSPLFHVRAGLPPIALLTGDNDIPNRLEENALFAAALRNAGNSDVHFRVIANRTHNEMDGRMTEPGDPVREELERFLKRCV